jgi:hypothetical protein
MPCRSLTRSALIIAATLSLACANSGSSTPTGTAGTTGTGGAAGGGSGGGGPAGAGGMTGGGGAAGDASAGATGAAGSGGAAGSATGVAGASGRGGASGGTGGGGAAGQGGASGVTGAGGTGTNTDAGTDAVCQMADYTFEPRLPTVYVVVDRSGSMFACTGDTNSMARPCADPTMSIWRRLETGILQVIQQLQTEVRFGFAAFNGTSGGTCPDIRKVSPQLDNYAPIQTLYAGLPFRTDTDKWETPTRRTLEMIGAELKAITAPGDKYILFVTDGEPDYCGDGNVLCPPDSVVAELQALKADGVTTIVFGIQSAGADIPPTTLQAFANAGAGEATVIPLRAGTTDVNALFDQCFPGGDSSSAGWRADFLAKYPECATNSNACRGRTIGTYAAAAGPTMPYKPAATDQAQLVQQLRTALSNTKSCVFDLSDVGGRSIKVDPMQLDKARVSVMGTLIPHNDANGWRMNSQTQLELVGSACTIWRMPTSTNIDFQFPCSTIIFE